MRTRSGFAIPTTLLLVTVMSVSLGAGFALVTAERRSVNDDEAQIDALTLAEQGMEKFLIRRDSLGLTSSPPGATETATITLSGGYATVTLTRLRAATTTNLGLYVVQSKGVQTSGAYAGTPSGVRTVAQYVLWKPVSMDVRSSWTSITGILKNGAAGQMSGVDACGDSATLAGVSVPADPGYTQTGTNSVPVGDPPIETLASDPAAAADMVKIDWNAIINQNAITPTVEVPTQSWPSFADTSYWPVIRVKNSGGNFSLPSSGRGILIVEGSLTIKGAVSWSGVVLVGGTLTSDGYNTMSGAIVTGLNVKLGQTIADYDELINDESEANGTKNYKYNSCSVSKALGAMGGLLAYQNTWSDSWAEY